jgi:aspartate aminotransferase, cytoplasmic
MALIMNDAALFEQWNQDIKTMAHRIIEMREKLHHVLTQELHTPGNWDHILRQIGMFRQAKSSGGPWYLNLPFPLALRG